MAGAFSCGVLHRAALRRDVLRQIRKHLGAQFYWCLRVACNHRHSFDGIAAKLIQPLDHIKRALVRCAAVRPPPLRPSAMSTPVDDRDSIFGADR